jgi:hypothetical protein
MATKQYDICIPRQYTNRDGQERTQWIRIGTAFQMKPGDDGQERDALSGELWFRVLPTDRIALFVRKPKPPAAGAASDNEDPALEDDISF